MKSYKEVFKKLKSKKQGALIAFTVIGDPNYKTSLEIVKKIIDAGADILELGLPFSDPIADGPTIQSANLRALNNGINTDKAFDFVKEIRNYSDIPVGILTYYNLVYQRGINKFYSDAKEVGVNSILISDLPIEESEIISKYSKENKVDTVFMISQLTDDDRIKKIAEKTTGFIYAVARLGVTGAQSSLEESTLTMVKNIRNLTSNPVCVGFGLSKPSQVSDIIKAGADGAIIGSAIVDLIAKNLDNKEEMLSKVQNYVGELKKSTLI
ncbi:tryptophan synthase subunit alpha [Candidatus Woesearchaeota archaeon]|nr:tryptophan synthase subunit alpha [Candidatus Woesearchaeota archaeon]MDP6647919.1 tryptophan synthase subunit alpha [Candidatus Woesearchaeota archaeon]|tara:strand:- start:9508 stop:10311 length:804 start_codon:yes stop_codon:yes gene_type:complete